MVDENKSVKDLSVAELLKLMTEVNTQQTSQIKAELKSAITNVNTTVDDINDKISELTTKVEILERRSRRNNIVIFGLKIDEKSELLTETLTKLNTLLGCTLTDQDINHIYMLKNETEKPPIILEFVSFIKKQRVSTQFSKLRGSGVSIANDASYEDRQKLKILRKHWKRAKDQNLEARIRGLKLEIGDKLYSIEELEKIEDDPCTESEAGENSASDEAESTRIDEQSTNQTVEPKKTKKKKALSKTKYSPKTRSGKAK